MEKKNDETLLLYCSNGVKGANKPLSKEEYLQRVNSEDYREAFYKIRQSPDEKQQSELKKCLLCREVGVDLLEGTSREIKNVKRLRRVTTLDFDHLPDESVSEHLVNNILRVRDEGKWNVRLIERSVRGGLHVEIGLPKDMTLVQVQDRFARDIDAEAYKDKAVKDINRAIFCSPEEDVLYRCPNYWEPVETMEMEEYRATLASSTPLPAPTVTVPPAATADKVETSADTLPITYRSIPRAQLVKGMEQQLGGAPEEGNRNNHVLRMAAFLAPVFDYNPRWLMQYIPQYGLPTMEWESAIANGCNFPKKLEFSEALKRVIALAQAEASQALLPGELPPPPKPRQLPPLIRLVTQNVPACFRDVVALNVFPALATHLHEVKFHFVDNREYEATLMSVQVAETGAGKSCIDRVIDCINADIEERDLIGWRQDEQWRATERCKPQNKRGKERPKVVIQQITSDTTKASFSNAMMNAGGRFIYAKLNEIELLYNVSGGNGAARNLIRLAYDTALDGQMRVSADSISGRYVVRFNFNVSTTPGHCWKFFRKNLTDGTISRLTFSIIPNRGIGSHRPVEGSYDEEFRQALRPYIENLTAASGTIACPEMERFMKRLEAEVKQRAIDMNSRAYDNLSHRAVTTAFLRGMVLYVAQGMQWSREIERFVRWSLDYDLACKMILFGKEYEAALARDAQMIATSNNASNNLLQQLPDVFTREELKALYSGKKDSSAEAVKSYKKRGYIVEDKETGTFIKTEFYHSTHKA